MSDEETRDEVRHDLEERLKTTGARKYRWRLGRRGAFLVMMGVLYFFLGYGYGFTDVPVYTIHQLEVQLDIFHDIRVWGILWMLSGAVAIVTAWWPPGRDAWGFVSLMCFSVVWSVLSLLGAWFTDAPRAGTVGLIFLVYSGTILIVSGMPDPTPLTKLAVEEKSAHEQ